MKGYHKIIDKYNKNQLIEMVEYIIDGNEEAKLDFLEYCQSHAFEGSRSMVAENQVELHWESAAMIIGEFDLYGGGDEADEDVVMHHLDEITELVKNNQISWEIRKLILDDLMNYIASDNSGFTDSLIDLALVICSGKEENYYLAERLEKCGSSYYTGIAARIFLKIGEDKRFIENKVANLKYGSDYLELAAYYKEHGDQKRALRIVQDGLENAKGRLDEIYTYLFNHYKKNDDKISLERLYKQAEMSKRDLDTMSELMHGYFQEHYDYEGQKKTLLSLLTCAQSGTLPDLYRKCSQDLTEDDFNKEEQRILKIVRERNLKAYFDIMLEKDESSEVLEYVLKDTRDPASGLDSGHYFSKRLAGKYPREIAERYWREVNYYVSLGKENNYCRAVDIMREIRVIMMKHLWKDEWYRRYQAFLEEHRRKRLLMKVLDNF